MVQGGRRQCAGGALCPSRRAKAAAAQRAAGGGDVAGRPGARLHHRHWRSDHRGRTGGRGERSEEHTSELQSLMRISYAVFCLKKKKHKKKNSKQEQSTQTKNDE